MAWTSVIRLDPSYSLELGKANHLGSHLLLCSYKCYIEYWNVRGYSMPDTCILACILMPVEKTEKKVGFVCIKLIALQLNVKVIFFPHCNVSKSLWSKWRKEITDFENIAMKIWLAIASWHIKKSGKSRNFRILECSSKHICTGLGQVNGQTQTLLMGKCSMAKFSLAQAGMNQNIPNL